jgi:hypothetical protein
MIEMYKAVEVLLALLQLGSTMVISFRSRLLRYQLAPLSGQAKTETNGRYISKVGNRNTLRQLTLPTGDPLPRRFGKCMILGELMILTLTSE